MRFSKKLAVSTGIKDIREVKRLLRKRVIIYDLYCICIRNDSKHLMEIFSAQQILKEIHEKIDYLVIGIADHKQSAFILTAEMVQAHIGNGEDLSSFKKKYWEA